MLSHSFHFTSGAARRRRTASRRVRGRVRTGARARRVRRVRSASFPLLANCGTYDPAEPFPSEFVPVPGDVTAVGVEEYHRTCATQKIPEMVSTPKSAVQHFFRLIHNRAQ